MDQLRREGHAFEFRLLENLKNTEVLATLAIADIAIDQVCGAWPGRFGIESLASGCVLVGGLRPDYCQYPETPPIVPFEPHSSKLADSLRSLIVDQNRRTELMRASYEYWQTYYSPEAFVRWFQRVLDGTAETFDPLPNHKEHLLRFAENGFQRFIIRWFY